MDQTYDVVVIGAGTAGLSAALALGRARRSVLVVDGGEPRNAAAGHVHNYLGREGTPPAELLALGRAELAPYDVEVIDAVVAKAQVATPGFTVELQDGREVAARRLVIATGLVDELPDLPGLRQEWGRTVLHCPYCHGWEVRDQPIGVLGTGPTSVAQALLFRQWTADLTLFLHTAPDPTPDERAQLAARGISIHTGAVAGWEAGGVRMRSGELVPREALVVAPLFIARADVLLSLGLQSVPAEQGGHVYGSRIPADPTGLTAVPGVWVAGNVTDPRAQVISSAAAGLSAAAALNGDLIAEETQAAVERARVFGREAWEERYRSSPAGVWSGNANPVLVAESSDLTPGRALDVGCGEGADALWLAERQWQVTATDISSVALDRAAERARASGLDVTWVQADLLADPPLANAFDLVSSSFLHLPLPERRDLYAQLADAVALGGTLLIVGHHPLDLATTMGRPALHDMFFTPEQLVADLDPAHWDVVVAEARPRLALDPEGREVTIHDTVLRARRIATA